MKNVVVIGSGLAGTLIANELAKTSKVTLLEKGYKDSITYPEVNYINKDFGAVKTFCYGGGGTTNLWHNGLIPIQNNDVVSDEFRAIVEEASAYTDKAASRMYFKAGSFTQVYQKLKSEIKKLAETAGLPNDGVDCLIYPKKYQKLEADSSIEAYYRVRNLKFESNRNRVRKLTYSIGNKNYVIKPDVVVLSAGALGTPLIVKKIYRQADFDHQEIGKGLADHPMGFVGKVKIKKELSNSFQMMSLLDKGPYACRTAIRIKSSCGDYTCCAFLRPALTMQNELPLYKYKSMLGASKGVRRIKNVCSIKILHPDILAEIYAHLFGVNIISRIYNILLIFEQKQGNSSITGYKGKHTVDWRITEKELAIYNDILKKLKNRLSAVADRVNIQIPITHDWLWSAAHHSSTLALGGRDKMGVIDKDLRLKLFENVYACDGSVIQEHSYANTGLTIGQLAMRLVESINRRD